MAQNKNSSYIDFKEKARSFLLHNDYEASLALYKQCEAITLLENSDPIPLREKAIILLNI